MHWVGGEEAIMLPHRAGSQRMARGGVSSRPDAWAHRGGSTGEKCAAEPLGPQVSVLGEGWARRACGRITQDRKRHCDGLGACDGSRKNTIVQGSVEWVPGPARRRGRGVSDGEQPSVGGRFRQPERTPFSRVPPAFGLRSLLTRRRKNGYIPVRVGRPGEKNSRTSKN